MKLLFSIRKTFQVCCVHTGGEILMGTYYVFFHFKTNKQTACINEGTGRFCAPLSTTPRNNTAVLLPRGKFHS